MQKTINPLARGVFMGFMLPAVLFAAIASALAGPLLYASVIAACAALGWNLVVVTLYGCAPVAFWQALVLLLSVRMTAYYLLRK